MTAYGFPRHPIKSLSRGALCAMLLMAFTASRLAADVIWIEGEKPAKSSMNRHPWWYDKVLRDQLSGGDLISNFDPKKTGGAEYRVDARAAGEFEFWVRANPVQAKLSYKVNEGEWTAVNFEKDKLGSANIAEDGKIDLRFIAWIKAGKVALKKGANAVRFRMESDNSRHGYLDCFVLANEPFQPRGILKPGETAKAAPGDDANWCAFDPAPDPFRPDSGIDLRFLNERFAGEHGYIGAKRSQFIHTATGKPVRFWAVNGPSGKDREALRSEARMLAKRGVNMVRVHGGYFDEQGEVKPQAVKHALEIVEEMKAEGIYCHFSIYFPLWLKPKPNNAWLPGYDGNQPAFAALYFNEEFQKRYRNWWKALLLTPSEKTGKPLIEEPAVAGLELVNEDSYFFWTFNPQAVPDPQLRIVETLFGDWLKKKYGTLDKTLLAWKGQGVPRDAPAEGRMGFRPLWNMFNEKSQRDQDAARFLAEQQRGFYREGYQFLRELGFKGVITASNWVTASPQVFGPLEKYSYTVGDFIDRHGYFGCQEKGEAAEWSVREGHTYSDRSALRFEAEEPGKPPQFVHPAMDPSYDDKPSMLSETTWNRPNRYRSEAPLYYAAYGALQDSDAIVHFALDTGSWSVKPGYFMQPWTLMSPAMMGQFPAAALLYRKGLVANGELLVDLNLKIEDLLKLQGTPLPQDASFDELRLKDVPKGTSLKPGNVIDPLVHYAGRTNVNFTERGGPAKLRDLSSLIDHAKKHVTSSTGQLQLDFGKGVLTINAPAAQGISGSLKAAGAVTLKDVAISSNLDLGHIIAVSLDDQPLATSGKILLQAMSEERPSGFRTERVADQGSKTRTVERITSIGHDPWLVREIDGTVTFLRSDAASLKVTALDFNGYPQEAAGTADKIALRPRTMYYLIQR